MTSLNVFRGRNSVPGAISSSVRIKITDVRALAEFLFQPSSGFGDQDALNDLDTQDIIAVSSAVIQFKVIRYGRLSSFGPHGCLSRGSPTASR